MIKPHIFGITINYNLGEDIRDIVVDMISISDREKCQVETIFNDKRIIVANKGVEGRFGNEQ